MPGELTVAIHQPNFFPWLGYFNKIARCDVFVFLDDVLIQKTRSSWTNRVCLLIGGEARWVTAPIIRKSGGEIIGDVMFDECQPWRQKLCKTLDASYRKAPFYAEVMEVVEPLIRNPRPNLSEYNIHAVTTIAGRLGLAHRTLRRASSFDVPDTGTERLIALTTAASGSRYLCGDGAAGYQRDEAFRAAGIGLSYLGFEHPTYRQSSANTFVPGLSIIDALFNLGWGEVRRLVVRD